MLWRSNVLKTEREILCISVENHAFRFTLRILGLSASYVSGKACFQHMHQTEESVHRHTVCCWLSCTDFISASFLVVPLWRQI